MTWQVTPLLLLFILPFPGTVALRLPCLAAGFLIAAYFWRRPKTLRIPCKAAFDIWAAIVRLRRREAAP